MSATVEELRYNGLGYLIGQRADWDGNGLSGGDPWFYGVYDERWRRVADARAGYAAPKASYLHHCAGAGGYGGSSYIDMAVLRDRDIDDGWTAAPDGTLEERMYICQDPRHADVVAIMSSDATVKEWVTYSPYGVPFAIPAGDLSGNGDNTDDESALATLMGSSGYSPIADVDFDGDVDDEDAAAVEENPQALGRGVLSATGVDNRKGYAGYEADPKIGQKYHVRNRVLDAVLGRWLSRDPLTYRKPWLYEYCSDAPVDRQDPEGLQDQKFDVIGPMMAETVFELTKPPPPPPEWRRCAGARGVPGTIAHCSIYGTSIFRGVSQACMCDCLPDDPAHNRLRACLLCMHLLGVDPEPAHDYCFKALDFSPFNWTFVECLWECW